MILRTLDLENIYTLHFCHINSWHSNTPNSQSESSFKMFQKCFSFIPLMCLSLFFTLSVSWFIFSLPCLNQMVISPRLMLQHIVWWFIFMEKAHSLLYIVKFIIFYDIIN
jgi:hypothetical protein